MARVFEMRSPAENSGRSTLPGRRPGHQRGSATSIGSFDVPLHRIGAERANWRKSIDLWLIDQNSCCIYAQLLSQSLEADNSLININPSHWEIDSIWISRRCSHRIVRVELPDSNPYKSRETGSPLGQ